MKYISKNQLTTQPQTLFTVLVLLGIFSMGASIPYMESASAGSPSATQLKSKPARTPQGSRVNRLPPQIAAAVRQDLSRKTGIPIGQFKVTDSSRKTWSNGCLGLPKPDEFCTEALVEGWRVVLSDGRQTWVYRTNDSGQSLRLEKSDTQVSNLPNNLPKSVMNGVLSAAAQRLNLPVSQLRLVQAQQRTWNNGCLGLQGPTEGCTLATVPGWQVIVASEDQRLVYRTNASGSGVRLDEAASRIGKDSLRQLVTDAVLKVASQRTGLPASELRILEFEQIVADGCLNLPRSGEACPEIAQTAWQVTVADGKNTWVYHANGNGSQVRLNEAASRSSDGDLPKLVADAVLQNASQLTGIKPSELRIIKVDQIQTDGCLNLPRPAEACTRINMLAWEVTVEGKQQRIVYRIDPQGSQIRLNEAASQISRTKGDAQISKAGTLKPVQLPVSQLPPSLKGDVVFRVISSGGFAGQTTAVTLRRNGQLSRALMSPAGAASNPVITRISPQKVRQFQQLLEQQRFSQFHQLSYPATEGSADFITVTLSSQAGTTQYADFVQDRLPQSLQEVIKAWNQLISQ